MTTGMTRTKIAVSLPSDLVDAARAAIGGGRASSVSAFLSEALEERVQRDDLDRLLEELLIESGGPLLDEEWAAIDCEASWR